MQISHHLQKHDDVFQAVRKPPLAEMRNETMRFTSQETQTCSQRHGTTTSRLQLGHDNSACFAKAVLS